jgi:hypothetical protein
MKVEPWDSRQVGHRPPVDTDDAEESFPERDEDGNIVEGGDCLYMFPHLYCLVKSDGYAEVLSDIEVVDWLVENGYGEAIA